STLNLSFNAFTGSTPEEVAELEAIAAFFVEGNIFLGHIQIEYETCSSFWDFKRIRGKRNIRIEERNKQWGREMWLPGQNLKNHQQY
ncbi:hypothetical protein ACJX0J_006158, partial [Zea mays]